MKKNKDIIIQDWAGNDLFIGPYNDPQVDEILAINDEALQAGDIYVYWVDGEIEDNVWEYI